MVLAISVFGVGTLAGYVWFGIAGALLAGLLVFAIATRAREGASPVTLALVGAALDASLGLRGVRAAQHRRPHLRGVPVLGGRRAGRPGPVGRRAGAAVRPRRAGAGRRSSPGAWTRWPSATTWPGASATGSAWSGSAAALAAVLLTGAAVAAAGPIAFVGLAVPHLARALVGADHRWTLAVSALLGPALLLGADVVGRLVAPPGRDPGRASSPP